MMTFLHVKGVDGPTRLPLVQFIRDTDEPVLSGDLNGLVFFFFAA